MGCVVTWLSLVCLCGCLGARCGECGECDVWDVSMLRECEGNSNAGVWDRRGVAVMCAEVVYVALGFTNPVGRGSVLRRGGGLGPG